PARGARPRSARRAGQPEPHRSTRARQWTPDARGRTRGRAHRSHAALLRAPVRTRRARCALRPERPSQRVAAASDRPLGRGEPPLHRRGRGAGAPDPGAARAALLPLVPRRVDRHPGDADRGRGGGERHCLRPGAARPARPRRDRPRVRLAYVLPRGRVSVAPDAWEDLLARADLLVETKDPRAAVTLYRSVLRQRPDHAGTWCRLGRALWSLGDHAPAIQALEAALHAEPEWIDALVHLAQMHRDRLDLPAERRCQARLVAAVERRIGRGGPITPALAQAYANALLGVGAGAAALEVLRRLDEAVPGQNLWLLEAEALERLGEYERMLALYRSHLERRAPVESPDDVIFLESGWNFLSSLGDLGARLGIFALLQQEGAYGGLRGVVRVTGTVANRAYLDYWSRHLTIVRDPSDVLHRRGNAPDRRIHDTNVVALPDGTFRYVFHAFAVLNARRIAAGRPPLLALHPEHAARGEEG